MCLPHRAPGQSRRLTHTLRRHMISPIERAKSKHIDFTLADSNAFLSEVTYNL